MTDEFRITMDDVRYSKMCSRGARAFFASHNLDWNEFLDKGLPESVVLATNDAMAIQVVEAAHERRRK